MMMHSRYRVLAFLLPLLMGATAGAQQDSSVRVRKVDVRMDDLLRELNAARAREDEMRRLYAELVARDSQKTGVASGATAAPRAATTDPMAVRMVLRRLQDVSQQQVTLKRQVEMLCSSEATPRGYLGVSVTGQAQIVTLGNRPVGFNYATYQVVESVEPGSPAEKAGIRARDVMIALGSRDLRTGDMFPSDLLRPGERIQVKVERDGRTLSLPVLIEPRPESFNMAPCPFMDATIATAIAPTPDVAYRFWTPDSATQATGFVMRTPRALPSSTTRPRSAVPARPAEAPMVVLSGPMVAQMNAGGMGFILGASVMPMNHDMSEIFHSEKGLLVLKVLQASPAEDAGLKGGDVLLSANDEDLTTARSLERVMNLSSQHEVKLLLLRKGKRQTVSVRW
jgi:C-terminal processing protease CtpA/Prc